MRGDPGDDGCGDSARVVDGIGVVTGQDPDEIAAVWADVLAHRGDLRDVALAARGRLGRDRMLEDYRAVLTSLLQAERAAA